MSHYQPIAGPSSHAHQPPPAHGPPPRFTNGMRPPAGSSNGHPSYSQPVKAILALGAERNLHHAQTLGLVAMNGQQPIPGPRAIQTPSLIKLDKETELCWVAAGRVADKMNNLTRAIVCYESVLQHNPQNADALAALASIYRAQEDYHRGADYYTRALAVKEADGESWGALGHCYLMTDDLPKAYNCYQQAIINSVDSKNEPKLWYGIGILYDRYGSLEHAEEAFASVIKMDPTFDRANEVYFRLGIIYKQQKNSRTSLQCFQYILSDPPKPLTEIDIWFQIGHVYEQQQDFDLAKDAYDRVLHANPNHAKVLQQLGGLYQRKRANFYDPDKSVSILTKSLEHDSFSWYLLGRAYMTAGNFGKAYEAYQQAVYRDGKNPAFWCSIGVLYCNINQFHDSLDAYSRAIRINPYLSEVWFNLGALYESCNDQMNDAVDAYQRTLQLDQGNAVVQARLDEIRAHRTQGTPLTAPPPPRDISPSSQSWQYAAHTNGPPNGFAAEGAEQAEQNGVAGPAHQLHGGPPPPQHHPSHQPGPQYPSNGHANGHGPMPPQPYRSNSVDATRRTSGGPYPPGRGPPTHLERPPLPQIRSYHDGDHLHDRHAGPPLPQHHQQPPPHYGHPGDVPPEHLRGKAVNPNRPPPSNLSGPPQMGSPYAHDPRAGSPTMLRRGSPSLSRPASQPSHPDQRYEDREAQERRWAAEDEARRRQLEAERREAWQAAHPGAAMPGPATRSGITSPTSMRASAAPSPAPSAQPASNSPVEEKGKRPSRLSNGSGGSPTSRKVISSPTNAKRKADEDYDEGVDTLLSFANSGGSAPTSASSSGPRPPSATGNEAPPAKVGGGPSGLTVTLKRPMAARSSPDRTEGDTPTKKAKSDATEL